MRNVLAVIVEIALLGQPAAAAAQSAGSVSFPTSGTAEAQRLQPDFAMAYWGESLCYNHPLIAEQVFALCSACHTLKAGEPAREGPSLSGVVGQVAGSTDKTFKYSPVMLGSQWVWDGATLDRFLTNPRRALPGTTMTFVGLKSVDERAAVACYLNGALPNDPLEPIADAKHANAGPLSGALLVTRDLAGVRKAYVEGAGLTMDGPLLLDDATRSAQRRLWQMPAGMGWQVYRLTRPSVEDALRVLVIVPDVVTPIIRRSYDRQETGPYALGFPMRDVRAVDLRVTALGLRRTLSSVNEYPLQLRDGTAYPVTEASYEIADNNRLVIMSRGGGLRPLGGIDQATGLGGPAYSSLIVEDAAAMVKFFTEILDYEVRSDRQWVAFQPQFRYVTLHARGARTGNLGLVEYAAADRKPATAGVIPRPPNRGLGGWTIPVRQLDATLERAKLQRVTVVSAAMAYLDPRFGRVRIATVLAPNGLLVELIER